MRYICGDFQIYFFMLKDLLLVSIGSFFGGALRYMISACMKNCCGHAFPWGTFAVNIAGCFLFGVLYALFSRNGSHNSACCLLLTTGVCGGFTTFSTFAHESVQMLNDNNILGFVGYVAASVVVGFSLVALGYWVVKLLFC